MKIIARRPRTLRHLWLSLTPLAVLLTHSGLASAREGNVFSLTLSESLMYDDNIFRLSPGADNRKKLGSDRRDDFVSSTTIGIDANKQLGRHTLYANLSGTMVKFQEFGKLDYTGEDSRAGWRGVFGADNSWDVFYKESKSQSDFADLQTALSNVVTTDTVSLNLSTRLARDWVFRPAFSYDKYTNSAIEKKSSDGTVQNLWLNFGYRPYTGNALELQYRHANRDYSAGGGGFSQNEVGALGTWQAGGATTLELRAAVLQQEVESATPGSSNFDQVIGYANYRWQASGASVLNFKVFREISTVNIGTDQDGVMRGANAAWTWTPLAKIKFDTIFDYRKRTFPQARIVDPDTGTKVEDVHDRTYSGSLAISYLPTQALTLQGSVKKEHRHAESSGREYKDNAYSLVLQYSF